MSTNSNPDPRVWLITGVSSGFGRAITEAALAAGDAVAGVVRRPELVADLVDSAGGRFSTVELDVTDTPRIRPAVADVVERLGRIDVLVNNAGTGMVGAVEETTDAELRALFDVNFFAPVELVRAVAPYMRARRSGTVVQMSSYCGHASYPGFSAYCSSKFAVEGLSESLAAELAPLGVRVLLVEPGAFRTNFFGDRIRQSAEIADYAATVGQNRALVKDVGVQPGDPAKAAAAILTALSTDPMPLRLPLGDDSVDEIRAHLELVRRDVDRWEPVSRRTAFEVDAGVADWGPARV
jgi:NAD(P)-dependent dehydrogenase (short-subunit alcohol dehydrogenase family)